MILNRLAVCISIVFLLSPVLSNTPQPADSSENHPKWSFLFQISSSFRLTNFDNATFGGGYFLSPNKSIRLTTRFGLRNDRSETSGRFINLETVAQKRFIDLNPSFAYYFSSRSKLRPYLGIGPTWHFYYEYDKISEISNSINAPVRSQTSFRRIRIGIKPYLGIEWSVRDRIRLIAEYGADFFYEINEDIDLRTGGLNGSAYDISSNTVRFGVSVLW